MVGVSTNISVAKLFDTAIACLEAQDKKAFNPKVGFGAYGHEGTTCLFGSIIQDELCDTKMDAHQDELGTQDCHRFFLNVCFSNRAIGSSSFHRFVSVLWDHCPSSGSRFSSQSLLARFGWTAACMCRIGRRAPRFVSRLERRSRHIRRHLQTSSGEGRSRH